MKPALRRKDAFDVLIIGPTPPPFTGVNTMIGLLVNRLRARGRIEVKHLETRDPSKSKNYGTFTVRNLLLAAKNIILLAIHVLFMRYRVIYLPLSQDFWGFLRDSAYILVACVARARVVIHLHGGFFDQFFESSPIGFRWYIRLVMSKVSRAIVLGENLKGLFLDLVPPDAVTAVHNGIEIWPDPGSKPSEGSFSILFMGVLVETKGFFVLIKAFAAVHAIAPQAKLWIAGRWYDEWLREPVETFIRENGLEGSVSFLGVVTGEEKRRLFAASDVFVLPSFYPLEGEPVVIIEAMASRLPVVSTRRGSIPECVLDGETGYLVPEKDVQALSESLIDLWQDPVKRKAMGAAARARFEESFTADAYASGVEAVLQEACGSR